MAEPPLLSVDGVTRVFGGGQSVFDIGRFVSGGGRSVSGGGRSARRVHAVQGVSLDVTKGETLGIVGESGCGKSTLARLIVGLDRPTSGRLTFEGGDLVALAKRDPRALARKIQYVFQDPLAALNPRKTIRTILEGPLIHLLALDRHAREARLEELMSAVNLASGFLERYPHELSGGQAQRVGIARALAADPELIVLDEPVSALDVSVQAQVLNLLDALKRRFGLTYIFISHDLSVVESVSDRVAVMYFGRIAELGPTGEVFRQPSHPYTHRLLRSAPAPGRTLEASDELTAELPDPFDPPPGCAFHPRCPRGDAQCKVEHPGLEPIAEKPDHVAACYHPHRDQERA